jgi:hypothetical protein
MIEVGLMLEVSEVTQIHSVLASPSDARTRLAPVNAPPTAAIYRARLTETGLAVEDSIALCGEYRSTGDWLDVKSRALKENLLGKGSRSRITKLLRTVERRIIDAAPPLDRPSAVARFLAAESKVPSAAKAQLLFVLALCEDIALENAFRQLVIPAVTGAASRVISPVEIRGFLTIAAENRPEVSRWTEQTRERWAQGLRLVLREAGFVASTDKSPSAEIRPPVVRVEVIAFLAHAIADRGLSGWPILQHDTIKNLLFTESDALRAARALNDRGWWSYAQSDRIMEFRCHHGSLEEWLEHGLGI